MSDRDHSSYLINVTRLRDLLQQEGRVALPVQVIERAFRTHDSLLTLTNTTADTDIGTTRIARTVEHLVSLGLTWGKLRDAFIDEEGRDTGVLWMGQDTAVAGFFGPLNMIQLPQGFRKLLCVHTYPPVFGLIVIGTNPTSDSYVCLTNLLTEILASDESITFAALDNIDGEASLHFPTSAMERLVAKSKSHRYLCFPSGPLSFEQTRRLFNGSCNNNNIEVDADFNIVPDDGAALIESLRSNHCPFKLRFFAVGALSETSFVEFTEALSINETLKEIDFAATDLDLDFTDDSFDLRHLSDHKKGMLLRAVATNRGLDSLSLSTRDIALDNNICQEFWSLVSRNTSLTRIKLNNATTDDLAKVYRSNCVVEALKRNATLTDIICSRLKHDPVIMREAVFAMLEHNRFRPRIQPILQVPNDTVRWGLLGKAMLYHQFHQHPSQLWHLLLVNSDEFAALVKPESEAVNSIARRVKRRRRLFASK